MYIHAYVCATCIYNLHSSFILSSIRSSALADNAFVILNHVHEIK